MDALTWWVAVIAALMAAAWYLSYNAARLDRLHARVEGSLSALDAQLVRRAEAALELANSGSLDPASALILAGAASESLEAHDERAGYQRPGDDLLDGQLFSGREVAESDLTQALQIALTAPVVEQLRDDPGLAGGPALTQGAGRGPAGAAGPAVPQRRGHGRPTGAPEGGGALVPAGGACRDAADDRVRRRAAGCRQGLSQTAVRTTAGHQLAWRRSAIPALRPVLIWSRPPMSADATTPANQPTTGTTRVKRGMAEMLKGGVIMDVVTAEQAKIAEDAGAVAVMALERVPADIRAQGGVSRMSDPDMIDGIIEAVSIPVMAKARIGHFVEAQVLQTPRRRLHRRVRGAHPGRLRATTSTSGPSPCPSSAAPPTSARRCAGSPRARR